MQHIVNGDSFAARLEASGVSGGIVVWRESLYEGPIGEDLTIRPLLEQRAAFMNQQHGVPLEIFIEAGLRQERELDALVDSSESIVLWFEYDLYDQLMLAYLLFRLQQAGVDHTRLFMVCLDSFPGVEPFFGLGQLTPEQTASLHGTWTPVEDEQLRLGSRIWAAYASSDPAALERLFKKDDLSALPFIYKALQMHMERFPSVFNGLSGLQHLVLQMLAEQGGQGEVLSLFRSVCERAAAYGLGDLQFWALIDELRLCRVPLIELHGGSGLPKFGSVPPPDFSTWRLTLLDKGYDVLRGERDHIHLNGIDVHIGGVHLQGNGPVWRWSPDVMRLFRE
ncbi:DUF1835 domain-containing protein [Paenibacillus athensensis]|uniref:DUF1835 domain-containing protein n=1 Tax=Paenibacillus athensensis TaxID=1967502 RepID=A0A4Y8Q6W0_9BACL|nr:DUF1835 domain-containing protein [Paenibacillus athensensis]MCD1260767.1 DUF1835 domain-containing protein [Paenibacillus athensensis]